MPRGRSTAPLFGYGECKRMQWRFRTGSTKGRKWLAILDLGRQDSRNVARGRSGLISRQFAVSRRNGQPALHPWTLSSDGLAGQARRRRLVVRRAEPQPRQVRPDW